MNCFNFYRSWKKNKKSIERTSYPRIFNVSRRIRYSLTTHRFRKLLVLIITECPKRSCINSKGLVIRSWPTIFMGSVICNHRSTEFKNSTNIQKKVGSGFKRAFINTRNAAIPIGEKHGCYTGDVQHSYHSRSPQIDPMNQSNIFSLQWNCQRGLRMSCKRGTKCVPTWRNQNHWSKVIMMVTQLYIRWYNACFLCFPEKKT